MFKYCKLVFLLNIIFIHHNFGEICDKAAQMKMQAVFRECATKSSDEFEDTKHAVTGEDQLQVKVKETVHDHIKTTLMCVQKVFEKYFLWRLLKFNKLTSMSISMKSFNYKLNHTIPNSFLYRSLTYLYDLTYGNTLLHVYLQFSPIYIWRKTIYFFLKNSLIFVFL